MKILAIACTALLASGIAMAENLEGTDELLCAAGRAQICFENGECFSVAPWELSIPDFVVIDTKEKSVSTTKAVEKSDGTIYLQGMEGNRTFSFVIEESSGHMTVAVVRDGFSVTVFGVCTDTDI
ncbi:MAG: hypothetical protein ACYTGS_21950 [Planctomycetota bacterium]|jgi:hypothetical protein